MKEKFSVLMSLYIKEKAEFFDECMKSILSNTILPDEIVIVLDGPISDDLSDVLNGYISIRPELYTIVPFETNQGLGAALREGVLHCKNELIARMDTDDICRADRFELQLKEFEQNPDLDICGGQIAEFDETPDIIVSKRIVPLDNESIKQYQKKRDAFNHMTVMYKKGSVIKAGNYESCLLMEDSLLWANMIMSGCIGKNIPEFLVYARIGKGLYERRGGLDYYKKYRAGRKRIYKTGFINWWDYSCTIMVQFIVAILPNKVRGFVFKKLLHR